MGKGPKKTTTKDSTTDYKSTTDAAQHGSTQVNAPDWLLNPAQKLAGSLGGLMDQGAGGFTPQMGDLTRQTLGRVKELDNTGAAYDPANKTLEGVGSVGDIGTRSLLDGLSKYENPYKQDVLNPVLADLDQDAGQQRAALAARGAQGGGAAFRGSRFGVAEGELGGALSRARGSAVGSLLNQMFDTSTRLSGEDAGRELTAAQANQQTQLANQRTMLDKARQQGDLATSAQGDIRDTLSFQNTAGGQETDFLNAQRQYPIEYQRQMTGLLGDLNPQTYFGQTSDGTSHSNTVGNETSHSKEVTKEKQGLLGTIGGVMNLAQQGMGIFGGLTGNPALMAAGAAGKK